MEETLPRLSTEGWIKDLLSMVFCHPAFLTYMQSTSCKMQGWMNYKLESRLLREISITSRYTDDTTLMEGTKETKELLDKGERGE